MPLKDFKILNKIGKIKFYHFYGGEKNKEFQNLIDITRKKIIKWNKLDINGLIIDVSKHSGGNMWPIVYGLNDILGNTTLFSWNYKKTKKNENKDRQLQIIKTKKEIPPQKNLILHER